MSCNCNTQKNKGLCQLLDLDVAYTGNAMEINGVYIRSGDNLRIVLDAILKGDQDQPTGETTNFWFGMLAPTETTPANIDDYYLQGDGKIWQYTQPSPAVPASWVDTGVSIGGVDEITWGSITGDINDQTDLLAFIQENALSADNVGKNLYFDTDGKLNAGMDISATLPGQEFFAVSQTGNGFPFADESGVVLYGGGAIGMYIQDGYSFDLASDPFGPVFQVQRAEARFYTDIFFPQFTDEGGTARGASLSFGGSNSNITGVEKIQTRQLQISISGTGGNNPIPTSATDTGTPGMIRSDSNYIYVCVAANQWRRSPLETW